MRQAKVYYSEHLAGLLTETDDGEYIFQYDTKYVQEYPKEFITFTMPVTEKEYIDSRLFPFFEGLIPEGWLLDIASETWRINRNDRMGLLLACCKNCIGAVSIVPINENDGE
jgi:serine/threonine-protein kinase HipA